MKRKPLSRTPRALARRLKTPICKTCGQPKIAVTSYVPGEKPRFSFECWTQGCTTGAWKPWALLKAVEISSDLVQVHPAQPPADEGKIFGKEEL